MSDRYRWADDRLPMFVPGARGCWIWTRWTGKGGYGRWTERGPDRKRHAHVVVWEAFNGPLPANRELDHLCGIEPCCNPAHLEPVTRRRNLDRRNAANGWRRRRSGRRSRGGKS